MIAFTSQLIRLILFGWFVFTLLSAPAEFGRIAADIVNGFFGALI